MYAVATLSGELSGQAKPGEPFRATKPLSRLPQAFIEQKRWFPAAAGLWKFADHICLGEARTVCRAMNLLATFPQMHDSDLFSLQDDQPVAYTWSKGRGSAWALNYYARMTASVSLACNMHRSLPWVESARQPADELSRT